MACDVALGAIQNSSRSRPLRFAGAASFARLGPRKEAQITRLRTVICFCEIPKVVCAGISTTNIRPCSKGSMLQQSARARHSAKTTHRNPSCQPPGACRVHNNSEPECESQRPPHSRRAAGPIEASVFQSQCSTTLIVTFYKLSANGNAIK